MIEHPAPLPQLCDVRGDRCCGTPACLNAGTWTRHAGHACTFTLGQLLAIAAICSTSRAPGAPRLARLALDHAAQHDPQPDPQETDR